MSNASSSSNKTRRVFFRRREDPIPHPRQHPHPHQLNNNVASPSHSTPTSSPSIYTAANTPVGTATATVIALMAATAIVPLLPPEHQEHIPTSQSRPAPPFQSQYHRFDQAGVTVALPPMSSVRQVPMQSEIEKIEENDGGSGVGPSMVSHSTTIPRSMTTTRRPPIVQPPLDVGRGSKVVIPERKEDKRGLWSRFGKKLKRVFQKKPSSESKLSSTSEKRPGCSESVRTASPTTQTQTQRAARQNSNRGGGARGRGRGRVRGGSSAVHEFHHHQQRASVSSIVIPIRSSSLHAYSTNDGLDGSPIEIVPYEGSPPPKESQIRETIHSNSAAIITNTPEMITNPLPLADKTRTKDGNRPKTRTTTITRTTTDPVITIKLVHTPTEQSVAGSIVGDSPPPSASFSSTYAEEFNADSSEVANMEEDVENEEEAEVPLQRYRHGYVSGANRANSFTDFDSASQRLDGAVEEEQEDEKESNRTDKTDEGEHGGGDHSTTGGDGNSGNENGGPGAESSISHASPPPPPPQNIQGVDDHDTHNYSLDLHSPNCTNNLSQPPTTTHNHNHASSPLPENGDQDAVTIVTEYSDPAIIYASTAAITAPSMAYTVDSGNASSSTGNRSVNVDIYSDPAIICASPANTTVSSKARIMDSGNAVRSTGNHNVNTDIYSDPAIIYASTAVTAASSKARTVDSGNASSSVADRIIDLNNHTSAYPSHNNNHSNNNTHYSHNSNCYDKYYHNHHMPSPPERESIFWINHLLALNATYRDSLGTLHLQLCQSIHQSLADHSAGVLELRKHILEVHQDAILHGIPAAHQGGGGGSGNGDKNMMTNYLAKLITDNLCSRMDKNLEQQALFCWSVGVVLQKALWRTMLTGDYEEDEFNGERIDCPSPSSSPTAGSPTESENDRRNLSVDDAWPLFKWTFLQKPHATLRELNEARYLALCPLPISKEYRQENGGQGEQSQDKGNQLDSVDNPAATYLKTSPQPEPTQEDNNQDVSKRGPDGQIVLSDSDWNLGDLKPTATTTTTTTAAITNIATYTNIFVGSAETFFQEPISKEEWFDRRQDDDEARPPHSSGSDAYGPPPPPEGDSGDDGDSSTSTPGPIATGLADGTRAFYMQDPSHCRLQSPVDPGISSSDPEISTPTPTLIPAGASTTTVPNPSGRAGASNEGESIISSPEWVRMLRSLLQTEAVGTAHGTRLPVWLVYAPISAPSGTQMSFSDEQTGTNPAAGLSEASSVHIAPPSEESSDTGHANEEREHQHGNTSGHGCTATRPVINNYFQGGTHYHYYNGSSATVVSRPASWPSRPPSSSSYSPSSGGDPSPPQSSSPTYQSPSGDLTSLSQDNHSQSNHNSNSYPNAPHESTSADGHDQGQVQENQQVETDLMLFSRSSSASSTKSPAAEQSPFTPLPPLPPCTAANTSSGQRKPNAALLTMPADRSYHAEYTAVNSAAAAGTSSSCPHLGPIQRPNHPFAATPAAPGDPNGLRIQTSRQHVLPIHEIYPWGHPLWRYDGSIIPEHGQPFAINACYASESTDAPSLLRPQPLQTFFQRLPSRYSLVDLPGPRISVTSLQQQHRQPQSEYQLFNLSYENYTSLSSSQQGQLSDSHNSGDFSIFSSDNMVIPAPAPPSAQQEPHLTLPPSNAYSPTVTLPSSMVNDRVLLAKKRIVSAAIDALLGTSDKTKAKKQKEKEKKKSGDKSPRSDRSRDNILKHDRSSGSSSNSNSNSSENDSGNGSGSGGGNSTHTSWDHQADIQETGLLLEGRRVQAYYQRASRRHGHASV
ncbi:MAG: hypothetical protein J3R72DRAFT_486097 [Linnemannia gamsii]|nr:MAG: hypothetical protein J3R72DRAFT_486097 [Linnemannia gamsii]